MRTKIRKKNIFSVYRMTAVLLVLTLSIITLPCAKSHAGDNSNTNVHVEKDETIYATLSYDGTPEKIIAVNHLKKGLDGKFTDQADYKGGEITLLTSDTSFQVSGENYLFTPENDIEDIYYRGIPENEQLPFDFSIEYTLDGNGINAQKLAGETGNIEISMNISSNGSSHEYYRNSYICQISVPMSLSVFSKISAPNGQMVVAGSDVTYTFMVLPSSSKKIRIEAFAKGFELGSFSIACIPFDISAFLGEDISLTPDDLDSLMTAAGQLDSGTRQLSAGLIEFGDAMSGVSASAGELSASQQEIYSGYSSYLDSMTQLAGGMLQLSDGLTLTASQGHVLADSFTDLKKNISAVFDSLLPLTAALPPEQSAELTESVEALKTGMESFDLALREYTQAVQTISGNAEDLGTGMETALSGANGLKAGLGQLGDGMSSFSKGISQMNKEFIEIENAASELSEGQSEFTQGLRSSVGLLDILAGPEYEGMPVSFVNSAITCNSVQFVISTPGISMADAGTNAPEIPEGKSFWQKFIELFTGLFR